MSDRIQEHTQGWLEEFKSAAAHERVHRLRVESQLTRLREAAQAVYNDLNEHLTDRGASDLLGTAVRLTRLHALRAALTQENPDDSERGDA